MDSDAITEFFNRKIMKRKIAIIGAGNMGSAIAASLPVDKYEVVCTAASERTVSRLSDELPGVTLTRDNIGAVEGADIVVLAVKPYIADGVIDEIKDYLLPDATVISVIAPFTIADLESKLKRSTEGVGDWIEATVESCDAASPDDRETEPTIQSARSIESDSSIKGARSVQSDKSTQSDTQVHGFNVLKVIPNTAIRNGNSVTFVTASDKASEESVREVLDIFNRSGRAFLIPEKDMNPCMVLASCGIAFFLRFIRAAAEGSVELGLRPGFATEIAALTAAGAASLLEDGSHPEVEIDKVTTAGGTTIKGLNAMEANGFTASVIAALNASAGK